MSADAPPHVQAKRCHGAAVRMLAATAALCALACGAGPRPNIVLVVTDDQTPSQLGHMPATQELLVANGISFERFFISDPLCCPSRATILLGQYRHNHLVENPAGGCAYGFFRKGQHTRTIGTLLQAAGYRTGYLGKYLNQYDQYIQQVGPATEGNHLLVGWDDTHIFLDRTFVGPRIHENGAIRTSTEYQTDSLAELAESFIAAQASDPRPFFLFIATDAPHEPSIPAERHRDALPTLRAPRSPSFDRADASQASLRHLPVLSPDEVEQIDDRYREAARSLLGVDEMVERVVSALAGAGELERTYVFFLSDNGYHYGEHRIPRGKGTAFEESVRVPLVVRGPGVARGVRDDHLTANVDILPTLLDLVGASPDAYVDGRSLVPLFAPDASPTSWRKALVLESQNERRRTPKFVALRTDRFKWIEYLSDPWLPPATFPIPGLPPDRPVTTSAATHELYDLDADPHELANRADLADAALSAALSERLSGLLHCAGAECRRIEDLPLTDTDRSPSAPRVESGEDGHAEH